MEEAVEAGLTICTGTAVLGILQTNYPAAKLHDIGWDGLIPRNLKKNGDGPCDCAVMPAMYEAKMFAGDYSVMDCGDGDPSSPFYDELAASACARDPESNEPKKDRDCDMIRVGKILATIPVSMPVRSDLAHSLGWSMVDLQSRGVIEELRAQYANNLPKSACPLKAEKSLSLAPQYLLGNVFLAGVIVLCGVCLHAVHRCQASRRKEHSHAVEAIKEDTTDVAKMLETTAALVQKLAASTAVTKNDNLHSASLTPV